jgi:hypothetical protein
MASIIFATQSNMIGKHCALTSRLIDNSRKGSKMKKLFAAILVGMFAFTAMSGVAMSADDTHKKDEKKKDDKKGH